MKKLLFISHRESESRLASLLVDYLVAALELSPSDIRCTSVPGHQLPFGRTISIQLKEDLNLCAAVIVLITSTSLKSAWVVFELGASWALSKVIVPVLAPNIGTSDLPGPLVEYPCVLTGSHDASSRMLDCVDQVAKTLNVATSHNSRSEGKLREFLRLYKEASDVPFSDALHEKAMAFEISWLIMTIVTKNCTHVTATIERIKAYIESLGLKPIDGIENLSVTDDGQLAMKFIETVGGRLAAKHPKVMTYFEAGNNLIIDLARNQGRDFERIISAIDLPVELKIEHEDKQKWANDVHNYFEKALFRGA